MISILLSSRSLMCLSVSFILLFIASGVFFISDTELSMFDWVFLFSSSLLK